MDRRLLSPFGLFQILLAGGSLLAPRSLPGPPVLRELKQVVTIGPGQGGQFPPAFPLTPPEARKGAQDRVSFLALRRNQPCPAEFALLASRTVRQ